MILKHWPVWKAQKIYRLVFYHIVASPQVAVVMPEYGTGDCTALAKISVCLSSDFFSFGLFFNHFIFHKQSLRLSKYMDSYLFFLFFPASKPVATTSWINRMVWLIVGYVLPHWSIRTPILSWKSVLIFSHCFV